MFGWWNPTSLPSFKSSKVFSSNTRSSTIQRYIANKSFSGNSMVFLLSLITKSIRLKFQIPPSRETRDQTNSKFQFQMTKNCI